ncbi:GrpB family protein [Planctomycetota bacterium]
MACRIEVVEYNPDWENQFKALAESIWPVVSEYAARIEHVGSTSIKGLWAKPIIDIDILVDSCEKLKSVIVALAKLGYTHIGDLGIEGREAFENPPCDIKHHLYVCIDGCLSYKNHLILRNHLRKNEIDRRRYTQLKRNLAKIHSEDIDLYIERKTEFILSILKQYKITDNELTSIRLANKK